MTYVEEITEQGEIEIVIKEPTADPEPEKAPELNPEDYVGRKVRNHLAEFFVESARYDGDGKTIWLIQDAEKKHKIIDKTHVMGVCLQQGNYMCQASICEIID
jgi:hypothetical protein